MSAPGPGADTPAKRATSNPAVRTLLLCDLVASTRLVQFWTATGKWPDCADEGPYDFKAECATVKDAPKEAFEPRPA